MEGATGRDLTVPADAGAARQVSNADEWAFPTATGSWGTISHFALMDAASGGNLLYHAALDAAQAVGVGATLKFAAGALKFSES